MVEVMLKFVKMHGLGNDYIVIGLFDRSNSKAFGAIGDLPGFAKRLCDRHFGIGADGLLLVMPPVAGKNSGRIRIINPDGTEAEMCGNGIRCAAKFLLDSGLGAGKVLGIETLSGVKHVVADGRLYRVDMGEPRLERREIPMNGNGSARAVREPLQLKYRKVMITAVSMGNPHAVVFVDDNRIDLDAFDISVMPSVGTPQPGGLHWYQVLSLMERLAAEKCVVGFDVTELMPIPGLHAPDFLAAKLVYKLIGYFFSRQ